MSIGTVYDIAYKGDFNQVKVRVDEDANIIHKPDPNERLLIHWAALGGNENLVDFLLQSGSPIDPIDDTNATPLILAAAAGKFPVVRILLGKGANVNHKTNRGQSALEYACSKGHKEIAALLIEYEANVNHFDVLGATSLHRAAAQGRTEIVQLLLACNNININACDSTGSTPLVRITNVAVGKLITYFDDDLVDITNAVLLDDQKLRRDRYGRVIDINEDRHNFVEIDSFIYKLKTGKNVIEELYEMRNVIGERITTRDLMAELKTGVDIQQLIYSKLRDSTPDIRIAY
ncbi:26S proteasome non-ATPase regulatory subunit 10 [Eumeta japonica]|uniref:26S proteasome non-ATPase regulatory subunit 10 n=1 Tax=Eumeta variegata TaxID=151549 RepID=A0A4C1VS95_EUMVA|nr:26S proteasome non-ATPase regulatory subunit 10 [Eumeta japonica]